MRIYAVDWAYNTEELVWYDGKRGGQGLPPLRPGDVVVLEAIPPKAAHALLKRGARILYCPTSAMAALRRREGWGKEDSLDAVLIWRLYQERAAEFREFTPPPRLLVLGRTYADIVKIHVGVQNRLWALGDDSPLSGLDALFERLKGHVVRAMEKELARYPVWTEWLAHVRGVGAATGGRILGILARKGIAAFTTPAKLWAYAGLHVVDGRAPRRVCGEVAPWNAELKSLVVQILLDSFIRCRTPVYRDLYDAEKERQKARVYAPGELARLGYGYSEGDTRLRGGHAERRARRKVAKIFLLHLWLVWRALEGLPLQKPRGPFPEPPNCPAAVLEKIRALSAAEEGGEDVRCSKCGGELVWDAKRHVFYCDA